MLRRAAKDGRGGLRLHGLALGAVFIAGAAPSMAAVPDSPHPFFKDLGVLPSDSSTLAQDVSAHGSLVIGFGSTLGDQGKAVPHEAFIWDATRGITALSALYGYTGSVAYDISGDGSTVVGESFTLPPQGVGDDQATLWRPWVDPTPIGLGFLAGDTHSVAHAVSADGSVVVGGSFLPRNPGSLSEDAFIWSQAAGMKGLGFLPGESLSVASGVSADGSVVVGESATLDDDGNFVSDEAFTWTSAGGLRALGFIAGDSVSEGHAVSADGRVVLGSSGILSAQGPPQRQQAFVWIESTGMVGLDAPSGAPPYSESLSASADGSIVAGIAFDYDGQGEPIDQRAFVWDGHHGVRWLQDALADAGLGNDISGWSLQAATGVSDDGTTLVGFGLDPKGATRGWIAYLPEPSSTSLQAAALASLALLRPRSPRVDRKL